MNKKGFTLIELLAVIIILAIIAVIAVPIVSNMIDDSKKNAAKISALSYIKAINDQNGLATIDPSNHSFITSGNVEDKEVEIKGDLPTSGEIVVENGKVVSASFCIHGYNVTYENSKATVGQKCDSLSNNKIAIYAKTGYTHKGIVYLDPTDLSIQCTESISSIGTGTEGCLKFYIFNDEDEDVYKLILDHNTTASVQWISRADYIAAGGISGEYTINGNNTKGPITAMNQLENDTNGWNGNPRLITADEVAHIVGADREDTIKWNSSKTFSTGTDILKNSQVSVFYFDGSGSTYSTWKTKVGTSTNKSNYAWLYDYTKTCIRNGCIFEDDSTSGYWTSNKISGTTEYAWYVYSIGGLWNNNVSATSVGIRPVIELPKSLFN